MDGHYAKWNKSDKDKYHMISRMCGIKKCNRLVDIKQKQETHTDTENKPGVTNWQRKWG